MCARRENVINERDGSRRRLREVLVDLKVRDELLDGRPGSRGMCGLRALGKDEKFADVEMALLVECMQYAEHAVVVERIVPPLRGRHRNEGDGAEPLEGERLAKLAGDLLNRLFLVVPLRPAASVGGFLEVQDEAIGLAVREAAAGGVLTEEVDLVGSGEMGVERAEEIIDGGEHPGAPPRSRRDRARESRLAARTRAATSSRGCGSTDRG